MALNCRFCNSSLEYSFVDLGMSPLCESYVSEDFLNSSETFYPLHAYVCGQCFLVQLDAYVSAEHIFSEYAYFSSYSDAWLAHAHEYVAQISQRFALGPKNQVIEVASNDGYLLQYFEAIGVPCLGIEPAANVARVAIEKGIETRTVFLNERTARDLAGENLQADLLIGNNVLAQVPDLNSFVRGLKILLKPTGVITLEFPHLMRLMDEFQYDTIYHEHFCYFSLLSVEKIFTEHGLTLYDVEELITHGGSLRIYLRHSENKEVIVEDSVVNLRQREFEAGFTDLATYSSFGQNVERSKRQLLELLIGLKKGKKTIVGYGAPGKGNTLLNYCGIRTDILDYTVDRNPYKQGKYLPGTRIPIYSPNQIEETKPDYVLILPWNFKEEIMDQISFIRSWGGQFIVPIPEANIIS